MPDRLTMGKRIERTPLDPAALVQESTVTDADVVRAATRFRKAVPAPLNALLDATLDEDDT